MFQRDRSCPGLSSCVQQPVRPSPQHGQVSLWSPRQATTSGAARVTGTQSHTGAPHTSPPQRLPGQSWPPEMGPSLPPSALVGKSRELEHSQIWETHPVPRRLEGKEKEVTGGWSLQPGGATGLRRPGSHPSPPPAEALSSCWGQKLPENWRDVTEEGAWQGSRPHCTAGRTGRELVGEQAWLAGGQVVFRPMALPLPLGLRHWGTQMSV